jgi:hypothetical protein
MTDNNKLDFSAVVNEVMRLMLHYDEKKDMSGIMKKSMVLKILKSHYKLTEDQIELISNFIDIIVLFHKIHRGSNLFKNCWKCS